MGNFSSHYQFTIRHKADENKIPLTGYPLIKRQISRVKIKGNVSKTVRRRYIQILRMKRLMRHTSQLTTITQKSFRAVTPDLVVQNRTDAAMFTRTHEAHVFRASYHVDGVQTARRLARSLVR